MNKKTVRELILVKFSEAMKTVVKARGFTLDIGQQVHRSRRGFFENELPGAALNDGPQETSVDDYGGEKSVMEVSILAVFKEATEDTFSILANSLFGEFSEAIGSSDPTWGELADDTQCIGFAPAYPEDGTTTVGIDIQFLITYTTVIGDPYTVFKP